YYGRSSWQHKTKKVPGGQSYLQGPGGTTEWIMINVRVGQETFYDVYRRKASERQHQKGLDDTSETELQQSIK
uniref:Uncharacterized protein n=1 Tax=Spermophilus dauricus TaxID=99837 RepID=A0A8C9PW70_SPEDA